MKPWLSMFNSDLKSKKSKISSFFNFGWESLIKKWIRSEWTCILFVLSISYIFFVSSPIDGYKTSDPLGTLLVSQSILEYGTLLFLACNKPIFNFDPHIWECNFKYPCQCVMEYEPHCNFYYHNRFSMYISHESSCYPERPDYHFCFAWNIFHL